MGFSVPEYTSKYGLREIAGLQNDKQEKSYKRNKTLALNSILNTSTHSLRV